MAAIGKNVTLRNAELDAITTFIGNAALLRIYNGTRPATGAAITSETKLAEFTLGSPFDAAASSGGLTPTLPADVNAVASGTASWARIVKSDGTTHVMDMDVGTSGTTIVINSTTITSGVAVAITAWTFTAGNA